MIDNAVGFADIALFPFIQRLPVLEHFRDVNIDPSLYPNVVEYQNLLSTVINFHFHDNGLIFVHL
jgi:hypothetical protein